MRSQLFRTSQSVTFIWISDEIVFSILKITNKKFLILFLNIIIWNNISMIKITVKETPFYSVIKITVIFSFCFGNLPIHMSSQVTLCCYQTTVYSVNIRSSFFNKYLHILSFRQIFREKNLNPILSKDGMSYRSCFQGFCVGCCWYKYYTKHCCDKERYTYSQLNIMHPVYLFDNLLLNIFFIF